MYATDFLRLFRCRSGVWRVIEEALINACREESI
jgi:hypothetical protein